MSSYICNQCSEVFAYDSRNSRRRGVNRLLSNRNITKAGCFVFKNGATKADAKHRSRNHKTSGKSSNFYSKELAKQPFYRVYSDTWQKLQSNILQMQATSNVRILEDLLNYVIKETQGKRRKYTNEILPTAALLTGINQSDHLQQFNTLSKRLKKKISVDVCVLQSRDCSSIKTAIESMVYNFLESEHNKQENSNGKRLRRSQCTIRQLKKWYHANWSSSNDTNDLEESNVDEVKKNHIKAFENHTLLVILPDFECFPPAVLQDLILILSSHCVELSIFLVLGIATSINAIHGTLPYHVTSKIKLRVFETQTAPVILNEILEKVILSTEYGFHLSGKVFKFLTNIFLYYDFSINGFIQAFKYCLLEHYFQGNAYSLCTNYSASLSHVKQLNHEDLECVRKQLSFRAYVEGLPPESIIAVLTDDEHLRKQLPALLKDCHLYFIIRRVFLEFLTVLVEDLPNCPLGKYRRELYAFSLSRNLSSQSEFKESWQLLQFLSREELISKITKALSITRNFLENSAQIHMKLFQYYAAVIQEKLDGVQRLLNSISEAKMFACNIVPEQKSPKNLKQFTSREELKTELLKMSKEEKPVSEYTKLVQELLSYIEEQIIDEHLGLLERAPALHELFIFSDINSVRRNIIGAPRASLHMALNNPHIYLQCSCCSLQENAQLLPTLPDISIAYKLHLECGHLINLYDWLQAFRSVVDFNEDDQEEIDTQIQARFTRSVAELQYLGYIKMSKRKTDHATRLTW
ncbi:origin recognition complex subunit 3 isoform 1-T1 [Glossina fuscipes fuscipes]